MARATRGRGSLAIVAKRLSTARLPRMTAPSGRQGKGSLDSSIALWTVGDSEEFVPSTVYLFVHFADFVIHISRLDVFHHFIITHEGTKI